jgi:hypothetical protein
VEVLQPANLKAAEFDDLAIRPSHLVACPAVPYIRAKPDTSEAAIVMKMLNCSFGLYNPHDRFKSSPKGLSASNRQRASIGAGVGHVDEVIDVLFEHAFNASGIPRSVSGLNDCFGSIAI